MKRQVTILTIASLLFFFSSIDTIAQSKGEREKEKEMQEQIEEEKNKAEELEKLLKQRKSGGRSTVTIHSDEMEAAVESARDAYTRARVWTNPDHAPLIVSTGDNLENYMFYGGSGQSTSLQYSRNVLEATFTKDMSFEIEKDSKRASINVSGTCKEGEIRIKITLPSGKTYTEVLIDEYGSVNWSKTFNIEEENGSKTGDWGFQISAKDATGNFRLSLKSY